MRSIGVRMHMLAITVCFGLAVAACRDGNAQNAGSTAVQLLENARVDSVDVDHGSAVLTDCPPTPQADKRSSSCSGRHLSGSITNDAKPQLKLIHAGDHVKVSLQTGTTVQIGSIELRSQPVAPFWRFLVMVLAYIATFLLATIVTRGHPLKLIIGDDNRYSNSQFQMALWFSILISTYVAIIVLRVQTSGWDFWGGVDIPAHLFGLSGASALTFGVAKGITNSKVQAAQVAGTTDPKPASKAPHFLVDLTSNDMGGFDLGDFQMLVITLLAVAMYLLGVFQFLGSIECLKTVSLPDVDTTILAAFGLGQGAYLTKKVAGNPGTS